MFIVATKSAQPSGMDLGAVSFAISSLVAASFTTLACAIGAFALNPDFFAAVQAGDVSVVSSAVPIAEGLAAIQIIHELGHWLAAARYGVKLSAPVVIPSLQLGAFGSITSFLSYPKNRVELFDVAVAGPLLGFVASLAALIAGLVMTGSATQEMVSLFPVLPGSTFSSSALVGGITSVLLPSVMGLSDTAAVSVHPLTVVGLTGLLVNALNFMPVGRIDGGRASTCVLGRPSATIIGSVILLLQALSGLAGDSPIQLFWGITILCFQRSQEIPCNDEVTELDDGRVALFGVLLVLTMLCLFPLPSEMFAAGAPDPFGL